MFSSDPPPACRYLLLRKIHGNQLSNTRLNSGDYFVLEQVLANLTSPKLKDQVGIVRQSFRKLSNYLCRCWRRWVGCASPPAPPAWSPS